MAEHGTGTAGESEAEKALTAEREAMLRGFITATTYSTVAVVVVLVLMAIFLL